MKALLKKLENIKKESFTIVIDKDIEEVYFWYDKKDNCISVRNLCHFPNADHYELSDTQKIIELYSEFSHLIK